MNPTSLLYRPFRSDQPDGSTIFLWTFGLFDSLTPRLPGAVREALRQLLNNTPYLTDVSVGDWWVCFSVANPVWASNDGLAWRIENTIRRASTSDQQPLEPIAVAETRAVSIQYMTVEFSPKEVTVMLPQDVQFTDWLLGFMQRRRPTGIRRITRTGPNTVRIIHMVNSKPDTWRAGIMTLLGVISAGIVEATTQTLLLVPQIETPATEETAA
jgi:hypothetical protein